MGLPVFGEMASMEWLSLAEALFLTHPERKTTVLRLLPHPHYPGSATWSTDTRESELTGKNDEMTEEQKHCKRKMELWKSQHLRKQN
jgi:hypothetical protein